MSEIRDNKLREYAYIQQQKQEKEMLLDADSKLYKELETLMTEQYVAKGTEEENEEEAERKIKEYLRLHNEGKEKNEYLVRGAELQCSCGSHTRKINLSPCHGVYIKGHPVIHELDCIPGEGKNITWFGICSNDYPSSKRIIVTGQDGEKMHGCKCDPKLVGIWMDSYGGTKILDNGDKIKDDLDNPVGCNTVTVGSFLVCQRGGIISPVNSGQDRTVGVAEFEEGQKAYDRVMNIVCNESQGQEDDLAYAMSKETEEYRKIKELAKQWNIDYSSVKWTTIDAIYWKLFGHDEFIHEEKLNYISQYKDVIKDAADEYDLPERLVAGIAYREYGGDPMWIDDPTFAVRSFDWCGPQWVDDNLTITKNPNLTSFGNVSIQVRRAWESLGYDESQLSNQLKNEIINSLKDPIENIYISAKHISDLRNMEYPGLQAEDFSDEQLIIIATRYNRGPDIDMEKLLEDTSYGNIMLQNMDDRERALEDGK